MRQQARAGPSAPIKRAYVNKVEHGIHDLQGAYSRFAATYNNKEQFKNAVAKIATVAMEKAIVPEIVPDVDHALDSVNDPNLHSPACQQFIDAINRFLEILEDCSKNGQNPVTIVITLAKEEEQKPKSRTRIVGIYDMINDNSVAIAQNLMAEHQECVATCEKIDSMINLISSHSAFTTKPPTSDVVPDDTDPSGDSASADN